MHKLKHNIPFFITIFFLITIFAFYLLVYLKKDTHTGSEEIRLISLSPSVTEYIYDLGLDRYLIANTPYCNFPEDAKNKEKIGSLMNINYEQIAKLHINTAIMQKDMAETHRKKLEDMGIKVIVISNDNISNIINSYDILGTAFNIKEISDKRKADIISQIESIRAKLPKANSENNSEKSAIVSVFRDYGSDVSSLTAAGGNTLYNDILELLGLDNPLKKYPAYTELSKESLISINPDFIFDIYYGNNYNTAINDWDNLPLKAVGDGNVIILHDDYISLPGPRIALTMEKFAEKLYVP